jgi:hypothetical protein
MLDKILAQYGFEAGLGVIVAAVWALSSRGVAMLVLGTFLVLTSILSQSNGLNFRKTIAAFTAWLGERLSKEPEDA